MGRGVPEENSGFWGFLSFSFSSFLLFFGRGFVIFLV